MTPEQAVVDELAEMRYLISHFQAGDTSAVSFLAGAAMMRLRLAGCALPSLVVMKAIALATLEREKGGR